MESIVKSFSYPDGTIQRVQLVKLDSWERLDFFNLSYSEGALDCFAHILRQYLIPACPWIFGNLVLFRIPGGLKIYRFDLHGHMENPLVLATFSDLLFLFFRGIPPKHPSYGLGGSVDGGIQSHTPL